MSDRFWLCVGISALSLLGLVLVLCALWPLSLTGAAKAAGILFLGGAAIWLQGGGRAA